MKSQLLSVALAESIVALESTVDLDVLKLQAHPHLKNHLKKVLQHWFVSWCDLNNRHPHSQIHQDQVLQPHLIQLHAVPLVLYFELPQLVEFAPFEQLAGKPLFVQYFVAQQPTLHWLAKVEMPVNAVHTFQSLVLGLRQFVNRRVLYKQFDNTTVNLVQRSDPQAAEFFD